jgi:hypothetical protein
MALLNLASMWTNYRAAGAERLLLCMLLHQGRADFRPIKRAVPESAIAVVQLRAAMEMIETRVRARGASPSMVDQEVSGARWWVRRLERYPVGDHIVENNDRPPEEVAREVLQVGGWL